MHDAVEIGDHRQEAPKAEQPVASAGMELFHSSHKREEAAGIKEKASDEVPDKQELREVEHGREW